MIHFEPLAPAHLESLHGWLQQPHVREFWDDGDRSLEDVERHYFRKRDVEAFVFHLDGCPAGYIQAYAVREHDVFAAWRALWGDTHGVDLFIGEVEWLGRGAATRVLRAFIAQLQQSHPTLTRVLIDPEVRNARAIHVYRQLGFTPLTELPHDGKRLALHALDLHPACSPPDR